jgi:hypothetical protein
VLVFAIYAAPETGKRCRSRIPHDERLSSDARIVFGIGKDGAGEWKSFGAESHN